MNKMTTIILVFLLVIAMLAGCSNPQTGITEQEPISVSSSEPIAASIPEPEPEPFTLTFDVKDIGMVDDIYFGSPNWVNSGFTSVYDGALAPHCENCGLVEYYHRNDEIEWGESRGLLHIDTLDVFISADENIGEGWMHSEDGFITSGGMGASNSRIYGPSGKMILETPYHIMAGQVYGEAFYFYETDGYWQIESGQTGFMDLEGNIIITPSAGCEFSSTISEDVFGVSNRSDPKAKTYTFNYNSWQAASYMGYMNLAGEWVLDFSELELTAGRWVSMAQPFSDGQAIIEIEESEWYVIDIEGNIIEQLSTDPDPIIWDEPSAYEQMGFTFEGADVWARDGHTTVTATIRYQGSIAATVTRDMPPENAYWSRELIYVPVENYVVVIAYDSSGSHAQLDLVRIEEMHGFSLEETEGGYAIGAPEGESPLVLTPSPDAYDHDARKLFIPVNEDYMLVRLYDEATGAYYCPYDKCGNLYEDVRYYDIVLLGNGNYVGTTFYDYATVRAEMEANYALWEGEGPDKPRDPATRENSELGNSPSNLNKLEYRYTLVVVGNNAEGEE